MTAMTPAQRAKAYRDRQRGAEARTPAPCGTYAAARRHIRKGEELCQPCATALATYQAERRAAREAEAQLLALATVRTQPHAYVSTGTPGWRTCAVCGIGANGGIHRQA